MEKNCLILGDALEVLKSIPDESVDLVITDPPYFISQPGAKITRNYSHYKWRRPSDIRLDFGEWDRSWASFNEYFEWTEAWFKEVVRVLKKGSFLFIFFDKQRINIFDLFLGPKYGMKSKTIFVWVKTNPTPSFTKKNFLSATEFIWVGSKGEASIKNFKYQKEMVNYFMYPNKSVYGETSHPTEKPVALIKHLIECCSEEEDLVLDPFAGSGSVGVACLLSNRFFMLVKKDKRYYEEAKERLKRYAILGREVSFS